MDYRTHYARLIERARGRQLASYVEAHHVIPKCLGGGNEETNLVELTPEEHYVAHQLLVKIHPANSSLAFAAMRMAWKASGRKAFGWLRRRHSETMKGRKLSAEHRAKLRRKFPEEHKAKLRASHVGMTGRRHSEETKAKMAALSRVQKRKPHSEETKRQMSVMRRGNKYALGTVWTEEMRARHSELVRAWWAKRKLLKGEQRGDDIFL